eukprot:2844609-Lingulodinium_polyedra.AAC.1
MRRDARRGATLREAIRHDVPASFGRDTARRSRMLAIFKPNYFIGFALQSLHRVCPEKVED